ncbi:hypothetical protein AB0N92_19460 [Streptomyces sp. NPDC093248]|uniref:hypothetical protein n=1 Tax=Streptomyces sp. NPDC093248 TaxID=3155072 RepID=UPI0034241402
MQRRGRTLRLTAVSALVVLALTGFTGRHGHGRSHSGGGGCSSSSQDHDSSSGVGKTGSGRYHDHDDDYYGSTTGGSTSGSRGGTYGTPSPTPSLKAARARLVSCATRKAPYATVEVTNPNAVQGYFTVRVEFDDERGSAVADNTTTVTVPAKGTARAEVELVSSLGDRDDGLVLEVRHCKANPVARPVG